MALSFSYPLPFLTVTGFSFRRKMVVSTYLEHTEPG